MTTSFLGIVEVAAIYCIGLLIFDYACFYQASIFTSLGAGGRAEKQVDRDPRYHLLPHWSLWTLASAGLVCFVLQFALEVEADLALVFADLIGTYFFTRFGLMQRGIS
jgi:hypothetical protein